MCCLNARSPSKWQLLFATYVLAAFVCSSSFTANRTVPVAINSVHILTESSIDNFLHSQPTVLLLFYAPWCHWCRDVIPKFAEAANLLESQGLPVKLAQIDAAASDKVGTQYNVNSYPTIRLYFDGQPREYTGGRRRQEIVNWVTSHLNTEIILRTVEQLDTFLESHKDEPALIAFFRTPRLSTDNVYGSPDQLKRKTFVNVSRNLEHGGFAEIENRDTMLALLKTKVFVPKELDSLDEFILLLNPHATDTASFSEDEHAAIVYPGRLDDINALTSFVKAYKFPAVAEFTSSNIFQDGRPIWVIFTKISLDEYSRRILEITRALARSYRDKVIFIHSNGSAVTDKRLRALLDVEYGESPAIRIFKSNPLGHESFYSTLKYRPSSDVMSTTDGKEFKKFLDDFLSGNVLPFVKSEAIPDPQEDIGPVYTLVAKEFEQKALRGPYDAVVEFYAPWCGHCRQLESTYRKVASLLQPYKNVRIFKMDATQNEVNMRIFGFPTIVLFPRVKGVDVRRPNVFYGERTAENLVKWIATEGSINLDTEKIMSGPATAKPVSPYLDNFIVEEL